MRITKKFTGEKRMMVVVVVVDSHA